MSNRAAAYAPCTVYLLRAPPRVCSACRRAAWQPTRPSVSRLNSSMTACIVLPSQGRRVASAAHHLPCIGMAQPWPAPQSDTSAALLPLAIPGSLLTCRRRLARSFHQAFQPRPHTVIQQHTWHAAGRGGGSSRDKFCGCLGALQTAARRIAPTASARACPPHLPGARQCARPCLALHPPDEC